MQYCAFCDCDADYIIEESKTPICCHCKEIYEMGAANQGTIVDIEEDENEEG